MLNRVFKAKLSGLLACFIIVFLLPVFIDNEFYLQFLTSSAIIAISVIGFDLLTGYTGYVSFGHAGFMGIGAYTFALLVVKVGMNFWFALFLAVILTGVIAYLVSIPTFRLSGIYFSIGTLAFSQIFYAVVYNWTSLTGGAFGLSGIHTPFTLTGYYYFTFISMLIIGLLVNRIVKSPIGKALGSIKENEKLASSVGVDTVKIKRFTFTVSGIIGGFAGAILVGLVQFASPNSFSLSISLEYLVITVVGGAGTLIGPAVAAFGLNLLGQYLAQFQELRLAFYGLILVMVIMFLPGGVMGSLKRKNLTLKWRQRRESNVTVKSTEFE
jgi:branched-chain amino acid transport system permease protein